jgi:membrane fusion protein, multidrug efflux system
MRMSRVKQGEASRDGPQASARRRPAIGRVAAKLVLAGALALAACGKADKQAQRPPPKVATVTVEPRNVPVSEEFMARTESSQQVEIYARVTGFLEKRTYTEGATVQAGTVLFEIDPKPYRVQVDGAKAALAQQEARLTTAQAKLARVGPLVKLNALSQKDLDNATGEVNAAQAAVDVAKANLDEADLNLSYATITSPLTGRASAALQQDGTYIGELNTKLASVFAVSPIWVNYSVAEADLLRFRKEAEEGELRGPGNDAYEVEISLPDGSIFPHKGRVSFRAPAYNPQTGTFLVRVTVDNPDGLLRPNQYVRCRILGFIRPDAIVVPERAVQQTANGSAVWVVRKDGAAELRPVVTGDLHGDDIFITEGLAPGDQVIVDGAGTLEPGALVKAEPLRKVGSGSTTAPEISSKR